LPQTDRLRRWRDSGVGLGKPLCAKGSLVIDPHSIEIDVLEFFFVFSRFEFALKEAGYVTTSGRNSDNAMPDWDAFVKKYKEIYQCNDYVDEAISYLLSNPPQKQKVFRDESGSLRTVWEPFRIDRKAPVLKTLVDIVKIVRNNLFHGGKYGDKGWDDKGRVELLLKNSTIVMRQWLDLEQDLNVYFNDWA